MEQYDAIVVGAGLAGLTCGLELADAGKKVMVVESELEVGGRTSSALDNGVKVKSGFHRFIGLYSEMPKTLRKAGIDLKDLFMDGEKIDVHIQHKKKRLDFELTPSFVPIKIIKNVLGNNKVMSPRDKACVLSFFLAGFKDLRLAPEKLDTYSVQAYAQKHGVSEDAFFLFVVPLSTGFCFLAPERYSAYAFFGLLFPTVKKFYKMRLSAFTGEAVEKVSRRMADSIKERGSTVKTSQKARRLLYHEKQVTGLELEDGTVLYGKQVVLANNLHNAKQLLKPLFSGHPWFEPMFSLPALPAVRLQIELKEKKLSKETHTLVSGTSMISFAEKSRSIFQCVPGGLSVILTEPDKFLTMEPEQTLQHVLKDARQLGLDFEEDITDYRQIIRHQDCYSLEPGNDWKRPVQKTPVKGLVLAGDYTKQPFFSTMEGAVASGQKAAQVVLQSGM